MRPRYILSLLDGTHWLCTGDLEDVYDEMAQQEGFESFSEMCNTLGYKRSDFTLSRFTTEERQPPEDLNVIKMMRDSIRRTWQATVRMQHGSR